MRLLVFLVLANVFIASCNKKENTAEDYANSKQVIEERDEAIMKAKLLYAENRILYNHLGRIDTANLNRWLDLSARFPINVCDSTSRFYSPALCDNEIIISGNPFPCLEDIRKGGRTEDELNQILAGCGG